MGGKILIVELALQIANDIHLTLEQAGYELTGVARSVVHALEMMAAKRPDIVLMDVNSMQLAATLNQQQIPFVYISENYNREVLDAAKMTQPYGFIVKPFKEKDLLVTLDMARYRQSVTVRKYVSRAEIPNFEGVIGNSVQMQAVFELVKQVAPLDTSVLISGETGTGKEGIADCIHRLSSRRNKPFVKVNCAALPLHLIESELFGHEKGAFTGALERRIGKFERANGGTIFLDEIGEMPADLQVKLLRVLQEREIERIGGNGTIKINVRVIAATNRNLEKEISEGRFRMDLYYRLHVFPVHMPPLRERREDITLLVQHFVRLYANNTMEVSPALMRELEAYHWPGNVRELQNLVERSVLMTKGRVIAEMALPMVAREAAGGNIQTIEELEREHIISVLNKTNHKVSGPGGAAELLNIPASTLASKMKKLGIVKV